MRPRLHGVLPAMLTHFAEDGGIDEAATAEQLEFLVAAGVHGLFALGTTGEFFTMSLGERKRVASLVVELAAGRLPVIVHVGANSTADTIELALHARQIGAAAVAAVTPYFFGLSQEALIAYYEAVARAVGPDFPLYLYNIPGCAANDLSEESVLRLSRQPNVAGIKSSAPDFLRSLELARRAAPGFEVVVGHDTAFLAALAAGIPGCISGNANAVPELFVGLYDAFQRGDLEGARRLDAGIARLAGLMGGGRNFSYLRAALRARGLGPGASRPPLPNIGAEEARAFEEAFLPALEAAGLGEIPARERMKGGAA